MLPQQLRGILPDQFTHFGNAARIAVRNNPPHRHPLNEPGSGVELGRALLAIQKPIHVSVLNEV